MRFELVPRLLLSTPHMFEVLVNVCSLITMQCIAPNNLHPYKYPNNTVK